MTRLPYCLKLFSHIIIDITWVEKENSPTRKAPITPSSIDKRHEGGKNVNKRVCVSLFARSLLFTPFRKTATLDRKWVWRVLSVAFPLESWRKTLEEAEIKHGGGEEIWWIIGWIRWRKTEFLVNCSQMNKRWYGMVEKRTLTNNTKEIGSV